ncbi:hypothetical protein [Cereibacter azotoformans]|uniref:Uncharacterized protein n=1 Tax=Cereibacter azotoformans TaxID=43057 RepID=A0A2T5K710_9RHOB|nr:hypothetical protein [Cereibacter azotoformans]MBO4169537.1 hypothetical protein [Cereibacter azotoformans]PTR18214.1 hypothetical protein C8J28_109174 [Cereibacter azotoformans]
MLSTATKPRGVIIPDHQALVDAISLEIKIITTKMAMGDHAVWTDQPLGVCAGRKGGSWKVVLFRLPHRCDAEKAIADLHGRFPLVTHTTWGTPSHHIAWQLMQTAGSDLDRTVTRHDATEWKDRFTEEEDPSLMRRQLEAMRTIAHKRVRAHTEA